MVHFNEEEQNSRIRVLQKKEEEELTEILSKKHGLPYINLSAISISTDALAIIPEEDAKTYCAASFLLVDKRLNVGVINPDDPNLQELIKKLNDKGYTIKLYMVSHESLYKAWSRYADINFTTHSSKGSLDISNEEIEDFLKNKHVLADIGTQIKDAISLKASYKISRIIVIILAGALSLGSSDVHVDPEDGYVRLRYRLDGVLVDVVQFDISTFLFILSRIKLLSGLKLNIKDNSQDGRFSIHIDESDIEIRTSLIPGAYGESIVLRILNPKSLNVSLEDMGIPTKLFAIFQKEISKPNGMILTTGPTGSGKTTTLYSFMKKVQTSEIKIITIEDPIEYHLPGITQTQVEVKKGYTFAQGLRSALRQDPDVIMVGEIRDNETADIAVNSALTGHLVFSTLHTNNAAGTFNRLIDLGMNPKILTSAINIAIAQRLVRRVCQNCSKKTPIDDKIKAKLGPVFTRMQQRGVLEPGLTLEYHFVAAGCDQCHMTGYKGRVGIFEAILRDEIVEKVLWNNPSELEIELSAEHQKIMSLAEDGVTKVLKGTTTLDELERVVEVI